MDPFLARTDNGSAEGIRNFMRSAGRAQTVSNFHDSVMLMEGVLRNLRSSTKEPWVRWAQDEYAQERNNLEHYCIRLSHQFEAFKLLWDMPQPEVESVFNGPIPDDFTVSGFGHHYWRIEPVGTSEKSKEAAFKNFIKPLHPRNPDAAVTLRTARYHLLWSKAQQTLFISL